MTTSSDCTHSLNLKGKCNELKRREEKGGGKEAANANQLALLELTDSSRAISLTALREGV